MHISYMKTIGIEIDNDESLLLELKNMSRNSEHILNHNSYYYLAISFTDVPSEDRNVWINNNEWFQKSTITPEYVESIIQGLDEDDGIMEEPVRDFLQLLRELM